jgi:hypothetical protein
MLRKALQQAAPGEREASAWEAALLGLRSPDLNTLVEAAQALGRFGNSQALGPLIESLKDSDQTVKVALLMSLGKIGDHRATPHVALALQDPAAIVRVAAAFALIALGDPIAERPLALALRQETDSAVHRHLQRAMDVIRGAARATESTGVASATQITTGSVETAAKLPGGLVRTTPETALREGTAAMSPGPSAASETIPASGAEHRARPLLSVMSVGAPDQPRVNEWDLLYVVVQHEGTAPLTIISLELEGPFETRGKISITSIREGSTADIKLAIKPAEAGRHVPVVIRVRYREAGGRENELTDLQFISVLQPAAAEKVAQLGMVITGDYIAQGGAKAGGDVFAPSFRRGSAGPPQKPHPRDFCPHEGKPLALASEHCVFCGEALPQE